MALRDIQEQAIKSVLQGSNDLILSAATAAGKTEAVLLPICSAIADDEEAGVRALYVGPLKALINDQFRRLESLCEDLRIPVTKWHGDAPAAAKRKLIEKPRGILLITPESLEAVLGGRGTRIPAVFGQLEAIVIDELHSFVGTERGMQLQSLLNRLESSAGRRIRRIGLSATLGEMSVAAEYLRPRGGESVDLLSSSSDGQELKLLVKGYVRKRPTPSASGDSGEGESEDGSLRAICEDLFQRLRGQHNLVFANSRALVEIIADRLRRFCESQRLPNEFFPHHGNLAKGLREELEGALKSGTSPVTSVCTSTLELGIDIGGVTSVAQVGPPKSVSSLRQRLGRSGRRPGEPAVLRQYIQEHELTPETPLLDRLRPELFQTVGVIELLLEGWCETPPATDLHLSTALQQVLALIVERGGVNAAEAFEVLVETGPFRRLTPALFKQLLRDMGSAGLIEQDATGLLLLGGQGERVTGHYSFFVVFKTPDEYRVQTTERPLGSAPLDGIPPVGQHMIFAGRRWLVTDIDHATKTVRVARSKGGKVPMFRTSSGGICCHVRERMRQLYTRGDAPGFLDSAAKRLLIEGREAFASLGLDTQAAVPDGADCLLFPWTGSREMERLVAEGRARGAKCQLDSVAVRFSRSSVSECQNLLSRLRTEQPSQAETLGATHGVPRVQKYEDWLSDELAAQQWASTMATAEMLAPVLTRLQADAEADTDDIRSH